MAPNKSIKEIYTIKKVYEFKVKKKFTSQTEIIDEANGITAYIHNTGKLKLLKGQTVKCRVVAIGNNHPVVELVDLQDFDYTSGLTEEKLQALLKERDIEWDIAEFVKLLLSEEKEDTFEEQCYKWLYNIRNTHDLKTIKKDCSDLLERSNLLDLCGTAQREFYQERLTEIIELTGYYISADQMIAENRAGDFINDLFTKLRISGFVYHPDKNFSILASLFMQNPHIMAGCINALLDIIYERDITIWKKEPFNGALTRLLELYIRETANTIDRKKDPEKAEIIRNVIKALTIQLSLLGNAKESDIIDPRLTIARLCTISSYINRTSTVQLLDNAFSYLFNDDIKSLNFTTALLDKIPYIIANHNPGGSVTTYTFTAGNAMLVIDQRGISLRPTGNDDRTNPVFPSDFKMWKNLQVFLNSKPLVSLANLGPKDLTPYRDAWVEIENDLFNSPAKPVADVRKQHRVGDNVNIYFVRQDPFMRDKFYCRINDEVGGEGYIKLEDIVPYMFPNPTLSMFLHEGAKLLYPASIVEVEADGTFHFRMKDIIKEEAAQYYLDDDGTPLEIICRLGFSPNADNGLAPAVTAEGISASVVVPPEFRRTVGSGSVVKCRLLGASQDKSHIDCEMTESLEDEMIFVADAFARLMNEFALEVLEDEEQIQNNDDKDTEKELDEDYIRQVILFIDRLALLDPDYIKSYNYLWFAQLMCRMIGWESQLNYYKGRMEIIAILHFFAVNKSIDEERLGKLELDNTELFRTNAPLHERFLQLRAVSYLGKSGHDDDLFHMANSNHSLRTLARLVMAFNIVRDAGMNENAQDIRNKIMLLLNLKGFESNLKLYGPGYETDEIEYKSSIIFVAGEKYPNPEKQMAVILGVIDSMLNTRGGKLYVGVNDQGMGIGVEDDLASSIFNTDKDKYLRAITDAVAMKWGNSVATYINVQFDPDNDSKDVLIATVKPHPSGVQMPDGKYYVRVGGSKRGLTPEEFAQYVSDNRRMNEPVVEEPEEPQANLLSPADEHPVQQPAPAETGFDSPVTENAIPTSRIRKNVLEYYEDDYVEPVAFLNFLPDGEFEKADEFIFDYSVPLTLTVLDDETRGYLVLGYENGHVVRVPIDEIMDFDNSTRKRYNESKLIFASIAQPGDYVLSIIEESRNNPKIVMRADPLDYFVQGNLQDGGSAPCKESLIGRALAFEILPSSMAAEFSPIFSLDSNKCGQPSNAKTKPLIRKLNSLGITEITPD